MARKFKTGDRVRVCVNGDESVKIGGYAYDYGIRKGRVGTVKQYNVYEPQSPYVVIMQKDKSLSDFNARELERVE